MQSTKYICTLCQNKNVTGWWVEKVVSTSTTIKYTTKQTLFTNNKTIRWSWRTAIRCITTSIQDNRN